ncbi:MAG: helix-turn-helix transcriptional regulator [Clostridia bacterium]
MGIRKYRKLRKLTQHELAIAVGVTQAYISSLENGKRANPSIKVLIKIADVLRVDVRKLLRAEKEAV